MEIKPIFEKIDKIAHRHSGTIDSLHQFLLNQCPYEYLKADHTPYAEWKKAVRKYIEELSKIEEWNKSMK